MKTIIKSRKRWFLIMGIAVLEVVGLLLVGLDLLSRLNGQKGANLYEEPQGRFSIQAGTSWEQVAMDGRYTQFMIPDPPMNWYFLVLKASMMDDAYSQAFEVAGFDQGLLDGGSVANFGDWQAYSQEDSTGLSYGLAGQIVEKNALIAVVKMHTDQTGGRRAGAPAARAGPHHPAGTDHSG